MTSTGTACRSRARRFLPLVMAALITAGLSVAALDRAPASPMPQAVAAKVQDRTPSAVTGTAWTTTPATRASTEAPDDTATRVAGVGMLALLLATVLGIALMMLDQVIRTRSSTAPRER